MCVVMLAGTERYGYMFSVNFRTGTVGRWHGQSETAKSTHVRRAPKWRSGPSRIGRCPGVGWIWALEQRVLSKTRFPVISTYDSGRTPDGTATLPAIAPATVDLAALAAALDSGETAERSTVSKREEIRRLADLQKALEHASARIVALEAEVQALRSSERRLKERLAQVARIAQLDDEHEPASNGPLQADAQQPDRNSGPANASPDSPLHPAARKLLGALAQNAPVRFTWGQVALAGLKRAAATSTPAASSCAIAGSSRNRTAVSRSPNSA
jgi:hypothetical protein